MDEFLCSKTLKIECVIKNSAERRALVVLGYIKTFVPALGHVSFKLFFFTMILKSFVPPYSLRLTMT